MRELIKKVFKKMIYEFGLCMAEIHANTSCWILLYQPEEPEGIAVLKKDKHSKRGAR